MFHFCQLTSLPCTWKLGPSGCTMFSGLRPACAPNQSGRMHGSNAAQPTIRHEFIGGPRSDWAPVRVCERA